MELFSSPHSFLSQDSYNTRTVLSVTVHICGRHSGTAAKEPVVTAQQLNVT